MKDMKVQKIFVYDDKLVLTYNYQHGTQTITLKEVEDFLGSDLVGLSPPHRTNPNLVPLGDGFGFIFIALKFIPYPP